MQPQSIRLEGRAVTLVPLERSHHAALCEVGLDPDLWLWTAGHVESADGMRDYIEKALELCERGSALPFAIRSNAEGRVVGCTRYGNIDTANRKLEIGWTWIGKPWQRTAINTEAKYLLLRHAFESLGCIRVEFKTDARNTSSRRALLRLGAIEEGTLRQHMITSRGHRRDSVYFSVLDREWPNVKSHLAQLLAPSDPRPVPPPAPPD